jgi:hypothetical protein
LVCACLAAPTIAGTISAGQLDDFNDGTTESWTNAAFTFSNVDGGQGGAGDRYLEVIGTGGDGPGSRIAVHNNEQWSGDYVSAGVTAIQFDLANFSATALEMRILILAGSDLFAATTAAVLPADGQWQTVTFGLNEIELTQVGGVGDLSKALSQVDRLLIRHDPGAPSGVPGGTPIVGTLGIDNVLAIPEPGSGLLLLGALCAARRVRP